MRIAVIGGGISGLGAAYLLRRGHDVMLFERDVRFGGHACTVRHDGLSLDCGFLVCNHSTYPLLIRLFGELGVRTEQTEMSFAVRCEHHRLEYASRRPLRQVRNLAHGAFTRLTLEITRWLRIAARALEDRYAGVTLSQFLDEQGLSDEFRRHFLAPFSSALWSTDPERVLDIPASFAVRFFQNHGLVGLRRKPWLTVTGGSRRYVSALTQRLGPAVSCGEGVRSVRRHHDGVEVRTSEDRSLNFDQVVVATHADDALRLMADPTGAERDALSRFHYTTNDTVLHTDERLLPHRECNRSAWNFHLGDCGGDGHHRAAEAKPTVTYYLNRLQNLDTDKPYAVTLNQTHAIDPAKVISRFAFSHPVFDEGTATGQRLISSLNGKGNTHFAGAHLGYGFHEDGLRSAVEAAASLGVRW